MKQPQGYSTVAGIKPRKRRWLISCLLFAMVIVTVVALILRAIPHPMHLQRQLSLDIPDYYLFATQASIVGFNYDRWLIYGF